MVDGRRDVLVVGRALVSGVLVVLFCSLVLSAGSARGLWGMVGACLGVGGAPAGAVWMGWGGLGVLLAGDDARRGKRRIGLGLGGLGMLAGAVLLLHWMVGEASASDGVAGATMLGIVGAVKFISLWDFAIVGFLPEFDGERWKARRAGLAVTAAVEDEDVGPIVPWRGVRRMAYGALGLVVVLAGVRAWWGWEAGRELAAEVRGWRERGEPVTVGELAGAKIADEQNAAVALRAAAKAFRENAGYTKLSSDPNTYKLPWSSELMGWARETVEANAEGLRLVRVARGRGGVNWGPPIDFRDDALMRWRDIGNQRGLADLLRYAAIYAHQVGDDAEAMELARDAAAQAVAVDRAPMFVSHLIGLSLEAIYSDSLLKIAPDLRIGQMDRAATPEQVQALIGRLLEVTGRRERTKRVFQADRVLGIEGLKSRPWPHVEMMPGGQRVKSVSPAWWEYPTTFLFKPFYQRRLLRDFRYLASAATAAEEANWAAASAKVPRGFPADPKSGLFLVEWHILQARGAAGMDHFIRAEFQNAAQRRAAAVALAIRLYEVDHGGKRPTKLAELVPGYLAEVPSDPFSAAGQAMGYVANAPNPFLYSVFMNGTDEVAAGTWAPELSDEGRWRTPDVVFFLQRVPPTTGPATQAGESGLKVQG